MSLLFCLILLTLVAPYVCFEMGRKARINEEDALAALSALSNSSLNKSDSNSEKHMSKMRERKATVGRERAEVQLAQTKADVHSVVACVAEAGSLHVGASSGGSSKLSLNPATGRSVHGKAWSCRNILRAAYTPVSSGSFAAVTECGHCSPSDCKAVVAQAIMARTAAGLEDLFGPPGEAPPTDFAVLCKMHDSTKQLVTIPEEPVLKSRIKSALM